MDIDHGQTHAIINGAALKITNMDFSQLGIVRCENGQEPVMTLTRLGNGEFQIHITSDSPMMGAQEVIESAKRMRASLQGALENAKSITNCQECGFGQHGEFEAIAEFDDAIRNLT